MSQFLRKNKRPPLPQQHTGEYEDVSAELQQGDPVRVVQGNRWVDGVVMSTDDQHLWDEVYKQMSVRSSDEDDDDHTKVTG